MNSDNPLDDALDQAEENQESSPLRDFDVDEFVSSLNEGGKSKTIGFGATPEMHQFWKDLQSADDVDIDVAESMRQHLENLAQRHPKVAEKAGRKIQIDREF